MSASTNTVLQIQLLNAREHIRSEITRKLESNIPKKPIWWRKKPHLFTDYLTTSNCFCKKKNSFP